MSMYKLTYESEDELENGREAKAAPDASGYASGENVLYDRSSSPEDKTEGDVKKERSDTTKSAINNAYAAHDPKKKKQSDRNFYAMFRDIKDAEDEFKKQEGTYTSTGIRFKDFLTICYLLVLSIGIVVLAVYFQAWTHKFDELQGQVDYLEKSVQVLRLSIVRNPVAAATETTKPGAPAQLIAEAAGLPPIAIKEAIPDPPSFLEHEQPPLPPQQEPPAPLIHQDSSGASASLKKRLKALEKKLKDNDKLLSLSNEQVAKMESRIKALERAVRDLEMEAAHLETQEQESQGMASLALQEATELGASAETAQVLSTGVAFEAYQLNTTAPFDPTVGIYVLEAKLGSSKSVTFKQENINGGVDITPGEGLFVAPSSGNYVFEVSFCTLNNGGLGKTQVSLMRDLLPIRSFRVPLFVTLLDLAQFDKVPFEVDAGMGVRMTSEAGRSVVRHQFTAMASLTAGEVVNVSLDQGRIVEGVWYGNALAACTSFLGYKV